MNNRLIGPGGTGFSSSENQESTERERSVIANRYVGGIEIVLCVEIENPLPSHDQVTVFLHHQRIGTQPSRQRISQIKVETK
jgi:hypothetical protein